ncbi:MAG TPA: ABC transporter permease [Vicinamibacterales bacterium]|nr:ABC transporter permease [Vicinamibacterales bacterium]
MMLTLPRFLQDVGYACRTLRRAPALVITAILSLGLGIASTTAVFSFVNAIQFKDLPFADPSTLVDIEETSTTELCAGCAVGTAYPTLREWQSAAQSFATMGGYEEMRVVVSGGVSPERVGAALTSADLFPTLGVQPVIGRGFSVDDDRVGAEPVALLSDVLWRRRYGGDPRAIGNAIRIDGADYTVIGVMPDGFRFPEYAQVWMPLAPARHAQKPTERSIAVIARLKPGADVGTAAAEMRSFAKGPWSVRVRTLHRSMTEETIAPSAVLLGAVAFVLLIACANLSNLLLVRASERSREISIRMAIGASRSRVVQLVLAESLVLGVAGGALGLILALWASRVIVSSFGIDPPYWIRFGVDWHVFAFCLAITLATSILFGLGPAVMASRRDPQDALKEGAGSTSGRRGRRVAGGLVIVQLALALTLLAGAGLLIETVVRTMRFDPGYDPTHVLEGDVSLPQLRYSTPASVNVFATNVLEQLARGPEAKAAIQSSTFFGGFGTRFRQVTVEGVESVPEGASPRFYYSITPGYFRMLGTRMREGREFSAQDGSDVVIVNEQMASHIWGGSPLGQRIRFGDKPWRTVVGVVANVNSGVIGARPRPLAYVPFASEPGHDMALLISAPKDAASLAPYLRAAVRAVDPDQPIEDVMTMAALFREQSQPSRFIALLMGGLSFVALGLASVGLYGVTAYSVRRRLREIGIRLALGGTPTRIVRLILASAWKLIAAGLVLGTGAAYAGTRVLEGVLFGTSPTDPVVFALVVIALALVATLASYLPARRAGRVDPTVMLRNQ